MHSLIIADIRGLRTSRLYLEAQILDKIPANLLLEEAALYQTKWFDYRRVHHGVATEIVAQFYRNTAKLLWAKYQDIHEAEVRSFLGHGSIFELKPVERNGLWKLRQVADRHGIPYGVYIMSAMNALLEDGWRRLPRPNQLYSPDIVQLARERWTQLSLTRAFSAEDFWFSNKCWEGHPDQKAHRAWLIETARRKGRPEVLLQSLVTRELLRLEDIPDDLRELM